MKDNNRDKSNPDSNKDHIIMKEENNMITLGEVMAAMVAINKEVEAEEV
jgi:hypothetical protein